ncbi:MAG: hypothetical protein Q4A44_00515 [Bacteroidales bacterium]|nr:hypothetical protein [Bacteroidales bacterium]
MITFIRALVTLLAYSALSLSASAQQADRDLRSPTAFIYQDFQPTRINLKDRRFTRVEANIFLKNGRLIYRHKGKVLEASTDNIVSIVFADSIRYIPIGLQVARVVTERDTNAILCITTIDQKRLKSETTGGDNLPYFELEDLGLFIETDGSKSASREYPIKHNYYIKHGEVIFPANQTQFRRHLNPSLKEAFRLLMHEKYWSWGDEPSLIMLLDYLN